MARKHLFSSLEPYKLTDVRLTDNKFGQGSYASVMEVNYMGLKCAGKKIHEILLEQGDRTYIVRHFEEECRILSTTRHPNIVQFLGVYFKENEKVPMLVMEFLPMNLTACVQKHGILPEEINYSILHDVALGLYYLHSRSPPIVHRDLSANNVLLTYNMDAKISDLGVARMLNLTPLQASRLTQTPGTPAYMPPEVMVANPKYDTSIDEFSYGVMMIHIFCGKWPEPECSQIRMVGGKMIPVTEAERRQSFLEAIGDDHRLMKVIIKCIHNDPCERMHAGEIIECMSEMVVQFPRKHLDLIEQLQNNAKETTQPRPQDDEQDDVKEKDSKEHKIGQANNKVQLTVFDTVEKSMMKRNISSGQAEGAGVFRTQAFSVGSITAVKRSPRMQSKYPKQLRDIGEHSDDPELTEERDSFGNINQELVKSHSRTKSLAVGHVTRQQALQKHPNKLLLGDELLEPISSREGAITPTRLPNDIEETIVLYDDLFFGNKDDNIEEKSEGYEELTVTTDKVTIVDSNTKSITSSSQLAGSQSPSEQHIYDIDEDDDVSSMVEHEKWYFGNIDSMLARTKCKKDGDFLVRYSIDKQKYIISCRLKDTCHHCIVQQLDSGEFCVGSTASKSISMLIKYLVTSGIPLDSSGTLLQNPVSNVDRWTRECTDFETLRKIGSSYSHSGEISEALNRHTNKKVITRSYNGLSQDALNAFLLEAEVLKRCNQMNIASLIGVCVQPNPTAPLNPVYTIVEYMPGGILLYYIKNERISRQKTQLCRMCIDIAKGLDYMHTKLSRAHADVAARNCLVGQDGIVKIFNLGNSVGFNNPKELRRIPPKSSLPVKWTAIETYAYRRHMLSDVWSYGVLLWEVFSGGAMPYPGMNNKTVTAQVQKGYRMDSPWDCPNEISTIMKKCWEVDPNQRPTFNDVISKLQTIYSERIRSGTI